MTKKPTQILSYLFLGGKSDAKSKETLQSLNIKYILNCTPTRNADPECGCPNFYQKEKLFNYLRIPIFDNIGEDIIAYMDSAFKFIEEGKHYGNVLVHCHKGVSRSASFVIGYLMRKNEFTFEEALSFVQVARPIVQPNEAFIAQLRAYQPLESANSNANIIISTFCGPESRSKSSNVSFDVCLPPSIEADSLKGDISIVEGNSIEGTGIDEQKALLRDDDNDERVSKRTKISHFADV